VGSFAALALVGCRAAEGPLAMLSGDGFFDAPWPSDTRTTSGHPDLQGYFGSRARGDDLFTLYQDLGEEVVGFATNPTIYFRFEGRLDTDGLPTPEESLAADAAVYLVNIDRYSPRRGARTPIATDFQPESTSFQPENLLAVQPVLGFALEPRTTYAVVVTTALAASSPEIADHWRSDDSDHELYAPLAEVLFEARASTDDVAVATVFTTRDPTDEVTSIVDAIRNDLSKPTLDQGVTPAYSGLDYTAYQGSLLLPNWQQGSKPYATSGGGFSFEEGQPVLAEWEQTRFTLSVPQGTAPASGWPVAIFSHGTGGDDSDFANEPFDPREPAAVLARAGIAGIGVSQPLHGDRWTGDDPTAYVFNYLNPTSGITSFRQGALDNVYLAGVLSNATARFTTTDEDVAGGGPKEIVLDATKVAYIGHSQGGMTGAIAAPYFGDDVKGVMLSGAGGNTTLAVVYRKEGELDIQAMITALLGLDDDEELDSLHPVCAFIQFLSEPADPINYAPYWNRLLPWWDSRPQDVMMTEGLEDIYTPPQAAETLAVAGGVPILDPVGQSSDGAQILGLVGTGESARGNLVAWDGAPITGGLTQFPEDGHFAIYDNDEAVELYQGFLHTAVEDDLAEIPARP
jgi:pimeloyl-ACP methyl ester carboxylesterase